MTIVKSQKYGVSLIALLFANSIPLFGVLFFKWDLFDLILLYWCESAVIALYNIIKMIKIGKWLSAVMIPFFIVHFGTFMVAHFIFIVAMFGFGFQTFQFSEMKGLLANAIPVLIIPIGALFVSHGISFVSNFLGKKEYEIVTLQNQMTAPYKRIIVMHITIIFGGFLTVILQNVFFAFLLLIVLKTFVDIKTHIKEHSGIVAKQ